MLNGLKRYAVEFKMLNGEWYEDSEWNNLADAMAELTFHVKVSGVGQYGARIRHRDTGKIVYSQW